MHFSKVFCVGLNKTGTTSLHDAFVGAGLRSRHGPKWTYWSQISGHPSLHESDAFSDGECACLPLLTATFPDAGFVLNTRPLRSWLVSRHLAVERSRRVARYFGRRFVGQGRAWHVGEGLFLHNGRSDLARWIRIRNSYHAHVLRFFEGDERLLVLDLEVEGQQGWRRLEGFLGLELPARPRSNDAGSSTVTGRLAEAIRAELPARAASTAAVDRFLVAAALADEADNDRVIDRPGWLLPPSPADRILSTLPALEGPHRRLLAAACRHRAARRTVHGRLLADQLLRAVRCRRDASRFVAVHRFASASR
jgi:hypothetical protein